MLTLKELPKLPKEGDQRQKPARSIKSAKQMSNKSLKIIDAFNKDLMLPLAPTTARDAIIAKYDKLIEQDKKETESKQKTQIN